ncbi:MAG: L-2-hydroxyglutarate oxidase [Lentisphaerae bacterium]|nr:L-2-hydroxyglutarate oxidase [Lentisphaerota bacterium]
MQPDGTFEVAVIGGGIVGLATAMALGQRSRRVVIFEAADRIAAHQTGHNSGVIHSGLYYKPGSLKAKTCAAGRDALYAFCDQRDVRVERCGKIVVATDPAEVPALDELHRRGVANGLEGLRRLGPEEIREIEPHAAGIDGLFVPQTGIVDFTEVCKVMAAVIREQGGQILTSTAFAGVHRETGGLVVHGLDAKVFVKGLVNCAGLQADRVARLCGIEPGLRIVPFRGEYFNVKPGRRDLVKNLVYPVPDPRLPFLGVHFTRRIGGGLEAGPNAVLAFRREGYKASDVSLFDVADMLGYGGFWRMAARNWRAGLGEFRRAGSPALFAAALRKLVPDIREDDLEPGGAGVRAQAVAPDGSLCDDFRIAQGERMVHVLNAPSPAATASIAIGQAIADFAARRFE